ncbi:MAG: hypothetical protein FWB71_02035 [Defluviitaleaceae bacterium]|nr:hypothetical protein [Defluviitaleaceae bacterium]
MLIQFEDKTIRSFDEIEQLYPDNFILIYGVDDNRGYIAGLSTANEFFLTDYADYLLEKTNPKPEYSPYLITYGKNIDSSIGGFYIEG